MTNITIKRPQIMALLQDAFASNEDTRYYLQGVAVQPHELGHILIATDGHVMAAYLDRSNVKEGRISGERLVVLDGDILRAARVSKAEEMTLEFPEDHKAGQDITASVTVGEHVRKNGYLATIDGAFPEWRRVLPSRFPRSASKAALSPWVYPKLAKAVKVLGQVMTMLGTDPLGPQVASFENEPDLLVAAMPYRRDELPTMYPNWFKPGKS